MWFYCPNFKASIGYGESPYLNPKKQDLFLHMGMGYQ